MVWLAYSVREQIRITDMYSLFEVHYENGYAFPGESHNFWECLYVMEGDVCASGDERVYNLPRGSIIFHRPLELHKFIVNGPRGADLLIFSFAAEGPLTSYLAEKVFQLSRAQQDIIAAMLSFIHARMEYSKKAMIRISSTSFPSIVFAYVLIFFRYSFAVSTHCISNQPYFSSNYGHSSYPSKLSSGSWGLSAFPTVILR